MCGIFGIVSKERQNICAKIIDALVQLQNRGYDSSGLCLIDDGNLVVHKYASTLNESSLDKLRNVCNNDTFVKNHALNGHSLNGHALNGHSLGIGHNRWATHGQKNDINAHPHLSCDKRFAIVHNGIIENYAELKQKLLNNGFTFASQTDSEVIANLISFYFQGDVLKALRQTINDLQGTYGIIVIDSEDEDKMFCVRNGSPLLVGKNEDEVIVTSEQSGFCNLVSNYITLQNDDICIIERQNLEIKTRNTYVRNPVSSVSSDLSPHPFPHWTLKEIYSQPAVIMSSINNGGRIDGPAKVKLGGLDQHLSLLTDVDNIILLGCGTSYFACLYGMYFFKRICSMNTVQAFDGADFSEYDVPTIGKTACILVSQSGETKDLHRCIEIAAKCGLVTIGIINAVDSLIAREVDCGVYCNAGREIGVASTKAFTSQVVCLSLVSIWFSQTQEVNEHLRIKMISDLQNLSNDFKTTLENVDLSLLKDLKNNMFILGKGSDEFIAKEGSLKVKEISYVHCEGYSASSLKHGPFALLDETFPVIILDLDRKHKTKIKNCIAEVKSRNSPVYTISNDGRGDINVCFNSSYASLLGIVPIQLLAYQMSTERGINPDTPKNLAKVVTVE
jgi:glucosamine--fructose-6-phosphate aminotransferase (isomerizing)